MSPLPRHTPGKYDRTSRAYLLGAEIAENLIDMLTPHKYVAEYRRHLDAIEVADTDSTMIPYPGQYDGFCGFRDRAWQLIKQKRGEA